MESTVLHVAERDLAKKAKTYRQEKQIPAVFYGHDKAPRHLTMEYEEFRKLFSKAGKSTLLDLDFGSGSKEKVLVHDIQYHPVSDDITHVDFYAVKMKEKITTEIPLEFVGESNAVKNFGGILETVLDALEIRCLPGDLVSQIEVDISVLESIGDSIHVSDLKIPAGLEVITDAELSVASVQAHKEEEETPLEEQALVPADVAADNAKEQAE